MLCHYCNYSARVPERCPKCDSEYIQFMGLGSERVEAELNGAFPKARIARLDEVLFGRSEPQAGARGHMNRLEAAFGQAPFLVRAGYSIPVVSDFAANLPDSKIFVSGFSGEDDGAHSPNERMVLDNFHRGTEMVLHLFDELAEA